MGGADTVLEKARASFAAGDYRWVAEVVDHVVFADPANGDARALQADALEHLGYQSVSPVWRNFYLSGASELRHGVLDAPGPPTLDRHREGRDRHHHLHGQARRPAPGQGALPAHAGRARRGADVGRRDRRGDGRLGGATITAP
jgi:hypothetical protein